MRGVTSQAGFAVATSWGHAWATPTVQLRLVSESLSTEYDKLRSKALIGEVAMHEFDNGHVMVSGDLVVDLAYDDHAILEYCMGAEAAGVYTFTNDLDQWLHLTVDKNTTRYQFRSCKVNSWTLTGEAGSEDPVQLSMNLTAYSTVSSATAFPSLSAPGNAVYFPHLTSCYLGDQVDALSGSDALNVKSFEISCDNNLQTDAKDSSDPVQVIEPIRNGFRTVTTKLGLARYRTSDVTDSLYGWKVGSTRLQSLMTLSSGSDSFIMQFPEGKISEGANFNVSGPGVIEDEVTVEWFRNLNNTPMTAISDQLQITTA